MPPSLSTLLLRHGVLPGGGFLLGLLAAYLLTGLPMPLPQELEHARELGIVSLTTLSGYPKSRDLLTYAASFGLPFLGALALWGLTLAPWRTELAHHLFRPEETPSPPLPPWPLLALLFLLGALAGFNINYFTAPGFNPSVGAWISLGEEGENLAWVHSLRHGGTFGRDFFCLYGPMLLYPLAWLMELTGPAMTTQRLATYALDLLALAGVLWMLGGSLKHRPVLILAALGWTALFSPLLHFSVNTTHLRVVLALLPLYLLYRHHAAPSHPLPWLAGALLGQSLLFSQEAGLCALLAGVAMLGSARFAPAPAPVLRPLLAFLAATLLSMAPMLLHLHGQGALGPFLEDLHGYPRLVTLGYGSLPYPSLREFLADPLHPERLPYYGFIFFYGYAALRLSTRLWSRGTTPELAWRGGLLLFGLLLYRSALGRSDLSHLAFTLPPALLLWVLFLDDSLHAARTAPLSSVRRAAAATGSLLALALLFLLGRSALFDSSLETTWAALRHPQGMFQRVETGVPVPGVPRADVTFDALTARDITRIHAFLEEHTRPGDPVYFFPNEALYYFLFDRSNPTRYAIAYFAVTAEQRRELVADLERVKPRYVVYSLATWRVDDIPEGRQVPEVTAYIRTRYRPVLQWSRVWIMERVEA